MEIQEKIQERLEQANLALEEAKEMKTKIGKDLSLKRFIGVKEHDKIMTHYIRQQLAAQHMVNVLTELLGGEV